VCAGCRVTRLSRYNPDVLCGACTRAARVSADGSTAGTASWLPGWMWDSPLLREALARMDLGAVMAVIRVAAGLTQLQLAQIVGCSQTTIWRLEAGERQSLYDIRELLRFADAVGMPRRALLPLILGRSDADRAALAAAEAGSAHPCPEMPGGHGAATVIAVHATMTSARYLRACADRLYAHDQSGGGASVRSQALELWRHARSVLDEADYADQTGLELASAAGDLAVRAGWACYDSDEQDHARMLYHDGLQLAGHSGDELVAIHATVSLSLQLADLARANGRPGLARQAIWAAEHAAEQARRLSSARLHALIAAREAVARAASGDGGGFHVAITRAWREMDRETREDDPAWLGFVRPAEIAVQEAKGRAFLGEQGADALYRDSLLDAGLSPRNRASYQAQLAAVLARNGDVAQAVSEADAVLAVLGGAVFSPRTLRQLQPVRVAAENAGMTEFCAGFDAVTEALTGFGPEPGPGPLVLAASR